MELSLRPEALFQFVSAVTLLLASEYYFAFYRKQKLFNAFVAGVALLFCGALLFYLRPSFGLAVAAVAFPVLASLFSSRPGFSYKLGILLIPALLVWSILVYPESVLARKYDPDAATFLRTHLFCFNARCVRNQIAAELNGSNPLPYERPLLEKALSLTDAELRLRKPGPYKSLGYDPDRMMYGDSVVSYLYSQFPNDPAARNRFYMHYYILGWVHQPVSMAGKILSQLGLFCSGLESPLGGAVTIRAGPMAERNLASVAPFPLPCASLEDYTRDSLKLRHSKHTWRVGVVASVMAMGMRAFYPLVLICSCWYGACLWLSSRRSGAHRTLLTLPAICTLYLFSFNVLHVLTLSIVHSVQLGRYMKCQLVYTLLAEGAGILLCVALWELRNKTSDRGPTSPAPDEAAMRRDSNLVS